MRQEKTVVFRIYLFVILVVILITVLDSCSSASPQKYIFECRKQSKKVLQENIPGVLFNMGYHLRELDTLQNIFIAEKLINSKNTKKGLTYEFVQMQIAYKLDTLSEINTYFVVETKTKKNITRKSRALSSEQQKKHEPDFLQFVEKMGYYCDERFIGIQRR